jgi:hypothetical protein
VDLIRPQNLFLAPVTVTPLPTSPRPQRSRVGVEQEDFKFDNLLEDMDVYVSFPNFPMLRPT